MGTRRVGSMKLGGHFGRSDHACWAYDSDAGRAAAAAAWLTDGLASGQRAIYVADAPVDALTEELASVPARDEAIERGALVVAETRTMYDLSVPIDAATQLRAYAAAVDEAIAAGFAGIRVAADITPLVADPGRRHAHLHWEQVADRYLTERPLAPLCLFDRRRITAFPEIEHIHPLAGPDAPPFSLHAVSPRRSALVGEIDTVTADALAAAIATVPDGDRTLSAADLRFVDAHAAWLLEQALARRRAEGRPLALHDAPPLVRGVWAMCGLDPTLVSR
jgi:anti-anti-sigma regulatory factor